MLRLASNCIQGISHYLMSRCGMCSIVDGPIALGDLEPRQVPFLYKLIIGFRRCRSLGTPDRLAAAQVPQIPSFAAQVFASFEAVLLGSALTLARCANIDRQLHERGRVVWRQTRLVALVLSEASEWNGARGGANWRVRDPASPRERDR